MTGLSLARAFYDVCRPILHAQIPDVMAQAAVGLVGEGSECFGCDDAMSQDHDYGPAFCLWLPRKDLSAVLPRVEAALELLPAEFNGYPSRMIPSRRNGRVGPLPIEDFYRFFTQLEQPPATWEQWFHIPEFQLAACTNGEVFADGNGMFTRWRRVLLAGYPSDVRLKKLSARCMVMAQAGQYNLPRCLQRGDGAAAMLAAARFAEAALSFVFLCNNRFVPFYKWAAKLAGGLPVLGAQLVRTLDVLADSSLRGAAGGHAVEAVEGFCHDAAAYLRAVGLSNDSGDWLWTHGPRILHHVRQPELLHMDMLQG